MLCSVYYERVLTFFLPLVFSVLVACDQPDSGTGRLEQTRCKEDGLCWQAVGKRSLEGAYRKGAQEIKFDAVFSPGRTAMTQYKDEWSFRLLDHLGATVFVAKSSNPPGNWSESDEHRLPEDIDEKLLHYRERNRLTYEAAQAIVQAEKPTGNLSEPWKQLCHYMQHQILESGHYGPTDADESAAPVKRSVDCFSAATIDDEQHKQGDTISAGVAGELSFFGEGLVDDATRYEEMTYGGSTEDPENGVDELGGPL